MQSRLLMRQRVCSETTARLLNAITRLLMRLRVCSEAPARLLNAIMPADATARTQRGYGSNAQGNHAC